MATEKKTTRRIISGKVPKGLSKTVEKRKAAAKKNPKKKKTLKSRTKKAGRTIKKDAKKAGKKVKKFAKTKSGYAAGGAGIGALLLGPVGAIAGAVGGSALHDNPCKNPAKDRHLELGDHKWGMFEDAYGDWTVSQNPEDLIAAYTAALESELHYLHAGVEHGDDGRGYGPASAESEGLRGQILDLASES